jgi:hypothetical protein
MTRGSTQQRFWRTLLWNRPFSFTNILRARLRLRVYFVYSYGLLPRNAFATSETETPQCFTSGTRTHKPEDAETFRRFAKRNRADVSQKFIFPTDRETLLREQTFGVSRESEISPNQLFPCHTQ